MPWDVAGLYIHLLAWSWDNGPLPNDAAWRERVIGPDAVRLWAAVSKRWKKTARGWINLRLERQREIQATFSAHGKQAASKRWAYAQAMPTSTPRAMPNASSSSASASASASSKDQKPPAAARPVSFRVHSAIAGEIVRAHPTADLGELAELFKSACAKQGIDYGPESTRSAIDAAMRAAAKRRA
jgi:uncharacterized protein YdaU (DUF1376 family)